MPRCGFPGFVLLLVSANGALGADRVTVAKNIPAPAGPWVVTLSLNYAYPYGAGPIEPVVFGSADGFAFQAGDVLTIQYQSGLWCLGTYVSVGTCVDANGYRNMAPANNYPGGSSATYGPSKYMDPATYPVYWMELAGTFADATGQIVGTPFKVGNGPINVTIPAGAARLQLGSNYCDYGSTRDYYSPLNVSVSGPAPPTMKNAGSMAHLAVTDHWKTTIVLVNSGSAPAQARLNFFDDNGNPLPLPLTFPSSPSALSILTSTLDRTVGAGASLTIESGGQVGQQTQTGWAQLLSDGNLSGFAIFGMGAGGYDQEAVVPLETRSAGSYVLWFDNTGGLDVGVAVANISLQPATVAVTIRDESGAVIGTDTVSMPAQGHTSFELPKRLAPTAQGRGTVEFRTTASGQIAVLGFRFNSVAFTTIPVLAK